MIFGASLELEIEAEDRAEAEALIAAMVRAVPSGIRGDELIEVQVPAARLVGAWAAYLESNDEMGVC